MSDLYWLTDEQMARLSPYFPKSHSKPRVDAVEKAFSRPKARLPKTEERTVNGLWTLIGKTRRYLPASRMRQLLYLVRIGSRLIKKYF